MVANSAAALILVISGDKKERRKGTQIESMHTLKKKKKLYFPDIVENLLRRTV